MLAASCQLFGARTEPEFLGPSPPRSQARFLKSFPGHVYANVFKTERGWPVPLSQLSKCVILNFRDSWHKCVCLL